MVLPQEIGDAAQDADRDRVMAWLDAGGSIDDVDNESELRTTIITELLRAGASLDACNGDEAAEDIIQEHESGRPTLGRNEHWLATKRLIAGVRKYGTFKRCMRAPHRDVLAVRGLAQRGKLATRDSVLNFLARLGDNGVCWHILSFWRATN